MFAPRMPAPIPFAEAPVYPFREPIAIAWALGERLAEGLSTPAIWDDLVESLER